MTEQQSMTEVAKGEAADVARTAAQSGGQVAGTVGDQASRVASEATRQARDLLHEGKGQLTEQAREGQRKAASGLHALSDQLQQMAERTDGPGMAPEVVRQAADRTRTVASWLEDRDPGDLLDEVRRFARRKPGVFLAGAALAGVVIGRLTRGAIQAQSDDSGTGGTNGAGGTNGRPGPRVTTADGFPGDPAGGAHRLRDDVGTAPIPPVPPLPETANPGYGAVPPAPPLPPPAPPQQAPGYSMPPNPPVWERR